MANSPNTTTLGDICSLPGITGTCNSLVERYYFSNGECKFFTWSGCGGNANNFKTRALCESTCSPLISSLGGNIFTNTSSSSSSPTVTIVVVTTLICLSLALSLFGLYHFHRRRRSNKSESSKPPHSDSPSTSQTNKSSK